MGNVNGRKKHTWRDVASRVAAAALGGYGLTYSFTTFLTLILPLPRSEAVLTAPAFPVSGSRVVRSLS